MSEINTETSYDIHASTRVDATPEQVYSLASDLTRMGEWSPENTGGEWTAGDPATVGARFQGHNRAGENAWTVECEVVDARPGQRFAWSLLTDSPDRDNAVWSFEFEPDGDGCLLTQRFRMHTVTDGLRRIMEQLPAEEAATFLEDRRAMLQDAMQQTVEGVKKTVESS